MSKGTTFTRRSYGRLSLDKVVNRWVISDTTPDVNLELKRIFSRISLTQTRDFSLDTSLYITNRLNWFMQMYPLDMTDEDKKFLKKRLVEFARKLEAVEKVFIPEYKPRQLPGLKDGCELWDYQCQFVEMFAVVKRMVLADDFGLGKTNQAIGAMLVPGMLPAAVVVESHMPEQWRDRIMEFSNLRVHIVKTKKVYDLPEADVYIFSYSKIEGWADIAATGCFKLVVYDEPQSLRAGTATGKGEGAKVFSDHAEAVLGLSATLVVNYGSEVWQVMQFIAPGELGTQSEFEREWCSSAVNGKVVSDPDALGAYLRERQVLLRRTEDDINRSQPQPNVLTHYLPFNQADAQRSDELAIQLAIRTLKSSSYIERGNAARQLDLMERMRTGIAKARGVAAYVRMLLEANIPVMLTGWHRDVYEIWLQELKEFNPVLYTGTESGRKKRENLKKFISGESRLFIVSNRSGAGIDGLQACCNDIVYGELDWSPTILSQLRARLRRYGQDKVVNAHYMICEGGSDPSMVDVLGLKASQSHGVMNPYTAPARSSHDESRMQILARAVLERHGIEVEATTTMQTAA